MLKIRYSSRAKRELFSLLEYLVRDFGTKKADEIFTRLEKSLEVIAKDPTIYPTSVRRKGLRRYVFSKQTTVYYQVKDDTLFIVSLRPNRKDQNKF